MRTFDKRYVGVGGTMSHSCNESRKENWRGPTKWVAAHGRKAWGGSAGLLVHVLWISMGLLCASAQQYVEVTGRIEAVTYRPGGTNSAADSTRRSISFVCVVGTNQWRIDNDFAVGAEVKWHFDGTNVYNSIHPTRPAPKEVVGKVSQMGLATVPFEVARSNLTLTIAGAPGGLPLGDVGVNIPWLAFCSGAYLRRSGRIVPLPVATLRHAPDGFGYSDRTETFGDELGLPQTVDLFTSHERLVASVKKFAGEQSHRSGEVSTPSFQDGIRKFHYAVRDSTNFLGWRIPVSFEYFQSEPAGDGHFVVRYGGTGKAISVRVSDAPEGLFDPSMRQTIVDYRFADARKEVRSITYTSDQAFALPTNAAALQRKFAAVVSRASQSAAHKTRVGLTVKILLLLVCASPVIALLLKKLHQHRKTKTT